MKRVLRKAAATAAAPAASWRCGYECSGRWLSENKAGAGNGDESVCVSCVLVLTSHGHANEDVGMCID